LYSALEYQVAGRFSLIFSLPVQNRTPRASSIGHDVNLRASSGLFLTTENPEQWVCYTYGKQCCGTAKCTSYLIKQVGYGTGTALFKMSNFDEVDQKTLKAIKTAIRLGYRHLDGAELYNNEPELGIAIRESGIPRKDFFITTKVINNIKDISGAIDISLKKLQLDFVDLYLIHSPWFASSDAELQAAWAEMEKVQRAGKAKAIGVSNYLQKHLEATLATATVLPVINQVEFHPYLQRQNLVPWAKSKGIATAAFGPLTAITKAKPGPCDEIFGELAEKYGVSQEAVALRWCIDQGVVAVTTSHKEKRLKDYLDVTKFNLTEQEVTKIAEAGMKKHFRGYNFMHNYSPDDRA
jgi:diketogulonate reductase-like aldo/keto reductase